MATAQTEEKAGAQPEVAARTGASSSWTGLRSGEREVWLNGEQIAHPLEHDELRAAAESMARVFDLQHAHADEMLAPRPTTGAWSTSRT